MRRSESNHPAGRPAGRRSQTPAQTPCDIGCPHAPRCTPSPNSTERLQRELDGLQGKSPLEQAREQAEILRADTAKFEKHIADLHEHRSKVQQKLTSATSEREEKQGTLANVEAQVAAAKETIAVQEVTPADVQRMHADTSRLETELSGVRAQKEALSTQGYEEDRAIQRAVERMEGKVQQLNNCSLRVRPRQPSLPRPLWPAAACPLTPPPTLLPAYAPAGSTASHCVPRPAAHDSRRGEERGRRLASDRAADRSAVERPRKLALPRPDRRAHSDVGATGLQPDACTPCLCPPSRWEGRLSVRSAPH